MYNVGAFPGKFFPPHRGHLKQIIHAIKRCQTLYIIVSDNEERAAVICDQNNLPVMPLPLRARWMAKEFKDLDNVCIRILDEAGLAPYPNSSAEWNDRLKKVVCEPLDVIFGGDIEYRETYEEGQPGVVYELMDRSSYPISATQIRGDYVKYYEYILDSAKSYFDKWRELQYQEVPCSKQ